MRITIVRLFKSQTPFMSANKRSIKTLDLMCRFLSGKLLSVNHVIQQRQVHCHNVTAVVDNCHINIQHHLSVVFSRLQQLVYRLDTNSPTHSIFALGQHNTTLTSYLSLNFDCSITAWVSRSTRYKNSRCDSPTWRLNSGTPSKHQIQRG